MRNAQYTKRKPIHPKILQNDIDIPRLIACHPWSLIDYYREVSINLHA